MAKTNILRVEGVAGNTDYNMGSLGELATGEYLRKLQGASGRDIYEKMRRSDPQVKSTLNAIALPIRRARYYVEPPTPADKEKAEIIEQNFLRGMTITWDDTLRHALLMEPFGFSILEKVWHVKDGLYQIRKLDPRLPTSIDRWEYNKEKRRLLGPVQIDTDGNEYFLPIEKILVFTNEREGDNWEGVSILRTAYKPWFIKERLEKLNAIKHDRHAVGIPRAKIPGTVKRGDDSWNQTENMLENIYANEMAYIMQPDGYEVDILGVGGDKAGTDALPSIEYCDRMIARASLAMFVDLGTTETGSRALGASFIELFLESLQATADYICEVISRFVIPEYCEYNWGAMKDYPRLKAGSIQKLDNEVIGVLAKAGVITRDKSLELAVRQELNLPEPDEPEKAPPQTKGEAEEEIPFEGEKEDTPPPPQDEDGTALKESARGKKFVDQDLSPEEKIPYLNNIEMRLNDDSATIRAQVLAIRAEQADDLILQITAGRKRNKARVIKKGEMHDLLMKEYKKQIKIGRAEVKEELERQKTGGAQLNVEPVDYSDFIQFAEEDFFNKVEGAAEKLTAMLFALDLSLRRQGIADLNRQAELSRSWESEISTQTWDKMANGAVNGGWGAGRTIEGNKQTENIEYAYYSAVLDRNTCAECEARSGTRHRPGDPEYATPNPACYGSENCRCITVYVHKAAQLPLE